MAREHIVERGDKRQYFEKYTPEIDNLGEIAGIINQGLQSAVTITQKANESTLASNQIDLSTKFLAENNKINTKYQADPTNPEREKELREAFDLLSSQYKVNAACQKQWNDIKTNVYDKYKTYNAQWVEKQQQTNIQTNLQNGYENLINQVSMLGMNGAGVDEIRLIYANGIEGLKNGATAGLGEVVVNDFLKDSNHDIMTTYISALALNNPLQAQALLKDEGVRNDIGRAETLEKLESYVDNSLLNQSKRNAVNELGNTLRAMNSDEAKAIMNGEADLNRVTKFIETNKKLPRGSKDLILGIYGIGSKTDYYYDVDNDKIVKKEDLRAGGDYGGSGGGGYSGGYSRGGRRGRKGGRNGRYISVAKMSNEQKQLCAESLENSLHDLISFSKNNINSSNMNIKNIKKNKTQQQASDFAINYLQSVASMQGSIDAAYKAGAISESQRQHYMNDYIAPVTDYIESNLKQLDESKFTQKLGYGRIAQQFNTKGLEGNELRETQRQKLFAQNYYLDELNKIVKATPALKNIYDIESLTPKQQQEIYKTASDNALKRAKRWTDKPEYFFAKEYPTVYSQPFIFVGKADAAMINRNVAAETYKRAFEDENGKDTLNLTDFAKNKMIVEINNTMQRNRTKANNSLDLKNVQTVITRPEPKTTAEFYKRIKALGVTPEKFMEDARKRGFLDAVKPHGVMQSLEYAHKQIVGKVNSMAGYYYALQQAEAAKARQNSYKK